MAVFHFADEARIENREYWVVADDADMARKRIIETSGREDPAGAVWLAAQLAQIEPARIDGSVVFEAYSSILTRIHSESCCPHELDEWNVVQ